MPPKPSAHLYWLVMDNERRLQLVAVHGAEVVGQLGLEQYLRVHQAPFGMTRLRQSA